jgi:hypothetical protein
MYGRPDDVSVGTPGSTHSDDSDEGPHHYNSPLPSREVSYGIASPFARAASFTRGSALLSNDGRRESGMGLLALVDPDDRKVIRMFYHIIFFLFIRMCTYMNDMI